MPSLIQPNSHHGIYDLSPTPVRGIPLQYFVRPTVRQGGVGQDIPKGFELPECIVDQCCDRDPLISIDVAGISQPRAGCDTLTVTWEITLTNSNDIQLTNIVSAPFALQFPGVLIVGGDDVFPAFNVPNLAVGASTSLTATTTYSQPAGPLSVDFMLPEGYATADQGQNLFGAVMFANLCPTAWF